MQKRHQRQVASLQTLDARAHRDNTADSFRAHDGRQPWAIAIAADDHEKIVLVDRRSLDRDHHFAAAGVPTSGISTALTTSAGMPNLSIWSAFMLNLLLHGRFMTCTLRHC